MRFICENSTLSGGVIVPSSKSHTIRAVLLASLAEGESVIRNPLMSADTQSAINIYSKLGAGFSLEETEWRISGIGGRLRTPAEVLDVANSGTTLRVALGTCSLLTEGEVVLTGDDQIQQRPCAPLITSLNDLGAKVKSERGNGCAPFTVQGRLRGGYTSIEARTSQYVTSLLLNCPYADQDTEIDVPLLYEKPYVQMTLDWLNFVGAEVENDSFRRFFVRGGQRFQSFSRRIPGDFSSATFFLVAGALGNNQITCTGLDMEDSQSDKAVVDFLVAMGADIRVNGSEIKVAKAELRGIEIDMNDCPDALPMMAVAGCFAKGTTRLFNVAHARIKETDRISVMCRELTKLGAEIEERPDGLVIHESCLRGCPVDGQHDHRVVMALTIAGLSIPGKTEISTSEAAAVTFPEFQDCVLKLGGRLRELK